MDSLKLVYLVSDENLDVVYSEQHDKTLVLYKRELYDPDYDFSCISNSARHALNTEYRVQYEELKDQAIDALFDYKQKSKVQQEADFSANKLAEMFADTVCRVANEAIIERVQKEAQSKIENELINKFGLIPKVHEIKVGEKIRPVAGLFHKKFETVVSYIVNNVPVFLTGPAGTGKNHICRQVADALGLEFFFSNAVTQEYKLTGFIDASGIYHETQFYKAFTNGGVFMLDEVDASVPEVLVILNAAIANRYFDFPNGKVTAHEDFRVVAAGNTFGTGADSSYIGRYQLDAASLDRFALVRIGYDEEIEKVLSNNDKDLIKFIHAFREAVAGCGMQHVCSYRAIEHIAKMAQVLDLPEVIEECLLKNIQSDDFKVLTKKIEEKYDSSNKYFLAYCAISPSTM